MRAKTIKIVLLFMLLFVFFGALCVFAAKSSDEVGMKFDGLAEYKTASVTMPLPLTYEATVRFPEDFSGSGGVIFGSSSGGKAPCFNFEVYDGGSPRLFITDEGLLEYDVIFDEVDIFNGSLTHIAITVNSTAGICTCYVNGEMAQSVVLSLPEQFSIDSSFALGGDNTAGNPQYFKGELFDVALYADVRSAGEIAVDSAGAEIDTDGLIAAYSPLTYGKENVTAMGDTTYNINYKCDWIKDLPVPEGAAYSFAVIGDIQSMTYYYPDKLVSMFEWIRDNAADKKIAFSIGLGDITEKNTEAEYLKVVEAYGKIDGVVPFSIIRGNHDRTSANSTAMYDAYISQDRYGDEITGSYDDTMHNTYRILRVGKVKYMFMNLDFVLSDGAMDWANEVISAHPECHVIVSTHIYRNMSGTFLKLDGGKFGAENNPEDLWNRVLSQHENIVMILYGHSPKDTIYRKQREGVHGNLVTEMLINPSETDKLYGGGGFVAMLYFSEDGQNLDVRYYSTGKGAYYRAENQFSLELDVPTTVEFANVIMNVGADETERNLTWYSQYDAVGEVQYAKSADGSFPESYSTVKATAVKATEAGYYSYKATMVDLEDNSSYVYRLVVGGQASECYTFNTYAMGDEFSFAFITDPQLKTSAHSLLWDDTLSKIKSSFDEVSIVVSGGDQTSDASSEDNFDWFISKHLTSLAISTTVGPPHDNTPLYKDHYNLPNLSSKYGISTPSSDYFYTYNNVLFMHLNVENRDYDGHIKFMENTIRDNPDCIWRVVVLHYSFFTGGNHSTDGSVLAFRNALGGKFSELDVDVVLSGHDHVYTRSHMMADGSTLSGDVVTDGSVTDPEGTLYICGTSSTGSGWYEVEHHDDDAYIAKSEDTNRKSVVIFSVTEDSLTLRSYFVDGDTPEEFDSFTINKTVDHVRLNKDSNMLEILDGDDRIPLVNAYAYTSATVRVVDGYWALSTDGGASYESLAIASTDTHSVLRIDLATGCWELSRDGGASFDSLEISTNTYTVKYVAMPGSAFGDDTDLSVFGARRFTDVTPDAPELCMPVGSLAEGRLYDWAWEYYLVGGDGSPVTSFEYGRSYVAYPVSTEIPVASTIYISTVSVPSEYTYTWGEAWDLVGRLAGETLTLSLKSDVVLSAEDAISVVIPVNLTLDLCGRRLDTSALAPAVKFAVGSAGSDFKVITSLEGGALNAGLNDFIEIGTNQGSEITIQYGSADTEALTVESVKYLVGANGNFKYTSTLNLSVYGGSYTIARGIIYVSNVKAGASFNVYNVTLKDASFSFYGSESAIVRAKAATGYGTREASFISAEGCTFTDTYKADHSSSRFIIREDCWYGTLSFTDCDFVGMSIGKDYTGAALVNCGTITLGEGCTFTNSKTTFNDATPISFFSDKVVLKSGCVLARTDGVGSAAVVSFSDAAEITWDNPVGYSEYWKLGTVPTYLGDSSFTVGDATYSLVLAEAPTAANGDKTYAFVSNEGYLYRYDSERGIWQISTNGGETYLDITEDGVVEEPTPEPAVGCTVTIDGVSTVFSPDTDFAAVIAHFNTTANKGKEVHIVLGSDMTLSSASSLQRNITVRIDLAGHKLTFAMGARFKTGNDYVMQFYSSVGGAELLFGTTSDGIQPGKGTVIFGSDEYKNTLTVNTNKEILNMTQSADGSWLRCEFRYCTVNVGVNNLIRLNAKGAGAVTVEMEFVGCTVNSAYNVVCYNYSSTLGATANGGVFTTASYINATDTVFNSTAAAPIGFFGSANFADRYFGTVSFEGCTFDGFILNGDIIYSDEALTYNPYYSSLVDYDPTKAITVGKNCVFSNYGSTFNDTLTAFGAPNVSPADNCSLVVDGGLVKVVYDDFACSVTVDGVTTYYSADTDLKDVFVALNTSANTGKEITIVLYKDMSFGATVNFASIKNYILNIDLAGNKLTVDAGGRIRFGGVFTLNIYSSEAGGELIFKSGEDCFQLDTSGLIVFGSEEYKHNLTVRSVTELINISQLANGSKLGIKFLYSDVKSGSNGLMRLNAKGAGAVTLEAEVVGCTVTGSSRIVCYNTSSSLSATSNGGVYTVDSYIKAIDSVFICTAEAPVGFFGSANFADRYFGTVSFDGCTFDGFILNGDIIYSDEAFTYNSYYGSLVGYDPTKAITVGADCVFLNSADTFTEDMSGFGASNVSLAPGAFMVYTDSSVMTLDSAEHVLSDWRNDGTQHWLECTTCCDGVKLNLGSCVMTETVFAPTCTEDGYTSHTCAVCGYSYSDNYVDAVGHSYGEWVTIASPTCEAEGTKARECSVCHETETEAISPLGHSENELGYCSVCQIRMVGASVKLGADLSVKYYVKLIDASILGGGDLVMEFIMDGEVVATVTEYEMVNGNYVFTFSGIAPQRMADEITATVKAVSGGSSISLAQKSDYSIKQNCISLLAKSAAELGISDEKYTAMRTLVSDLLAYGAAAQDYTDYTENGYATDGVDNIACSDRSPAEEDKLVLSGSDRTLYFKSATVIFDSVNSIQIKLYENVADKSLVMVKVDGIVYSLSELEALGDGVYRVTSGEIKATDFDRPVLVELIYDGEVVGSIAYSVNSYAYAMCNGSSENSEMKTLALALYRYGKSADEYAAIER